jgi:predicted chitinase
LKPHNQYEMMIFLAHVSHQSDGLKTYVESCAQSSACADDYQKSWCPPIEARLGKQYYGRGWLSLSYPCNYHNAGQALGVDLLADPNQVASSHKLACATALWFWKVNHMDQPARQGNFGVTTRIMNKTECGQLTLQQARIRDAPVPVLIDSNRGSWLGIDSTRGLENGIEPNRGLEKKNRLESWTRKIEPTRIERIEGGIDSN